MLVLVLMLGDYLPSIESELQPLLMMMMYLRYFGWCICKCDPGQPTGRLPIFWSRLSDS